LFVEFPLNDRQVIVPQERIREILLIRLVFFFENFTSPGGPRRTRAKPDFLRLLSVVSKPLSGIDSPTFFYLFTVVSQSSNNGVALHTLGNHVMDHFRPCTPGGLEGRHVLQECMCLLLPYSSPANNNMQGKTTILDLNSFEIVLPLYKLTKNDWWCELLAFYWVLTS